MNTEFYKQMLSQLNDTNDYSPTQPYRARDMNSYPMFSPGLQEQESAAEYLGLPGTTFTPPANDFGGYERGYTNPLNESLDRSQPFYNDQMNSDPQQTDFSTLIGQSTSDTGALDPYGEY